MSAGRAALFPPFTPGTVLGCLANCPFSGSADVGRMSEMGVRVCSKQVVLCESRTLESF